MIRILFGVLAISAWGLGSDIQARAETMKFKFYTYAVKSELIPIGDVEGHAFGFTIRRSFVVLENGEVATAKAVITSEGVKNSGQILQYVTYKFNDGSTFIIRSQGTFGTPAAGSFTAAGWTSEIIKGTGRFEGIKGTVTSQAKYLPVEEEDPGPKGIGETTITYTLPVK